MILSKFILYPFTGKFWNVKKYIFNYIYYMFRAYRFIKCSFGIFANKWHIFHRLIYVNVTFTEFIIKECYVLCNFDRNQNWFVLSIC